MFPRMTPTSRIKWLTGKDELVGRNPHDKYQTRFRPTQKLFLMTNTLPQATASDRAFWERLHLIPFLISFVMRDPEEPHERRAIKDLDLQVQKEESGILAWLVRGCLEWQQQGLNPPEQVTSATEEYRLGEDTITQFVTETCDQAADLKSNATDIYNVFKRWYRINITAKPGSCPAQKKFGSMLGKQFKKEKVGGNTRYFGLMLKDNVHQLYPEDTK